MKRQSVMNALTVDVEDYFQVSAFAGIVDRSQWGTFESRVCRNTDELLGLFDDAGVRGTFFVLGWVAERFPDLIRRIQAGGHELASHGYAHQLVYDLTPEEFRADLARARGAIGDATGVVVQGYRAPSYSITNRSLWALDVLVTEGYHFDSSIYPIHHDRYGIPNWPRHIHRIVRDAGEIWELPGSTVRLGGVNLPIGGGGYFRLLPYWWTARGLRSLNRHEHRAGVFYLHPWEIDPDQPRLRAGLVSRARHYHALAKTRARLSRLLRDFSFGTVSTAIAQAELSMSAQMMRATSPDSQTMAVSRDF
jgi:polysaccharide deacetylase family protein (PEP-CTERM system associated)